MKIETKKKLDYLEETKDLIRSAIEAKGQSIADSDTFRSYADKISSIESAAEPVVQPLNVTENGEYPVPDGVDGFAPVTVNVPDIPAVIHPLSITENGTYTAPANVDGYNPIVVEVPSEEPVLQDKEITENGSYSADEGFDGLGTVTVNIPDPTKTVLLAEQEISGFEEDPDLGYSLTDFEPTYTITEGETYLVAWDGVAYETKAVSADSLVEGAVIIGNGSPLGLPGNDEPFAIGAISGVVMYIAFEDASASHTIGIWQKVKTEFKLQNKTITENGEYTADSGFDGLGKVTVDVVASSSSEDLKYVTFMNHDGTMTYGKKAVAVGDDCADPIARGIFATPTRESDAQYNYTFYGWTTIPNGGIDPSWNKSITQDKTVYANFSKTVRYYTITYYDDDGTTVLKTESLAYGAMPSYAPTKDGATFSKWIPDATGVTGNTSYTASWSVLENVTFKDSSWDDIAKVCEAGRAAEFFNVGNYKYVTLTSENGIEFRVEFYVIGINCDNLEDGTKAGLTILSRTAIPLYQISDFTSNNWSAAGWANSNARNCLAQTLTNGTFPDDLTRNIKPVVKLSANAESQMGLETTVDKIWIPSATEYMGDNYASPAGQGVLYSYLNYNDRRTAKQQTESGTGTANVSHMTRSRYSSSYGYCVKIDGSNVERGNVYVARIGFCI